MNLSLILSIVVIILGKLYPIAEATVQEGANVLETVIGVNRSTITFFSVGIAPWLMATIVTDLVFAIIPDLKRIKSKGDSKLPDLFKYLVFIIYAFMQSTSFDESVRWKLIAGSIVCVLIAKVIDRTRHNGTAIVLGTSLLVDNIRVLQPNVQCIALVALFLLISFLYQKAYVKLEIVKEGAKRFYKIPFTCISITPVFYGAFLMFLIENILMVAKLEVNDGIMLGIECAFIAMISVFLGRNYIVKSDIGNRLFEKGYIVEDGVNITKAIKNCGALTGALNGLLMVGMVLLPVIMPNIAINPLSFLLGCICLSELLRHSAS